MQKNIKQDELGEAVNLSKQAISDIERGTRATSVEVIYTLARYFDVSSDYLLGLSSDCTHIHQSCFAKKFCERLSEIIPNLNTTDLEDTNIDISEYISIVDKEEPITFNLACQIVDELGISFDYMIGFSESEERQS